MKYQGACKCGAVKVGILTEPFIKYCCHCSHCRTFASKYEEKEVKPYHPAVSVWRCSVKVEGDIDYEQSVALGGLFAMKRGRCASCKQPVWEKGERFASPYAMVMAPPLCFTPDTNMYYDSGYKNGPNDMKVTIYSDFGSLMYEVWIILTVALPLLPASLLALFAKNKFKKE